MKKKIQVKDSWTKEEIIKMLDVAQSACYMPHDDDVLISRGFIEQGLRVMKLKSDK